MGHDEVTDESCSECEQLAELLAGYLDGELTAEVRQDLLVHAQDCENCSRLLHSLRRLVARCRVEPNCEMPVTVRRELWVTIRREISYEEPDGSKT
jgi:hypothetical protein